MRPGNFFKTAQFFSVKKQTAVLYSSLFFLSILLLFNACRKINEATTLGSELIPPVDNINTFETVLDAKTKTSFFDDTTKLVFTQSVVLGHINDPKFGATTADVYFNVAPAVVYSNPFAPLDSFLSIDSVVLSLAYTGAFYGDTNLQHTVSVYEIAQSAAFEDTTVYRFDTPTDFTVVPGPLGSKTFAVKNLRDSIRILQNGDTTRAANVLRIPLSNSIGERFKTFDTSLASTGGFRNDSIFYTLFKGLAIKSSATGNALVSLNLSNQTSTKLTVYFKRTKNNVPTPSSAEFYHVGNGQANLIQRQISGSAYETNIATSDAERIFLQATTGSKGSYGGIKIPDLDTFKNSIIHLAELIITPVDVVQDEKLTAPILYLDHKRIANNRDSLLFFGKDLFDLTGNFNSTFGGTTQSDGKYRFNITRYIQDVVTKRELNDSLRLFAPLQVTYRTAATTQPLIVPGNQNPGFGRVVLGGGAFPDAAQRMKLRIIYSKIQ